MLYNPSEVDVTQMATITQSLQMQETETTSGGLSLSAGQLSDLGNKLSQKSPDFDVRNFGFSKLSGLINSLKGYELRGEVQPGANSASKVFYVRKKD